MQYLENCFGPYPLCYKMENLGTEAPDVANITNKGGKSLGNNQEKKDWMNFFLKKKLGEKNSLSNL